MVAALWPMRHSPAPPPPHRQIVNPAVVVGNVSLVIQARRRREWGGAQRPAMLIAHPPAASQLQGFSPSASLTAWTLAGGSDPTAGNTPYQPALISPVKVRVCGGEEGGGGEAAALCPGHPRRLRPAQSSIPWPASGNLSLPMPPESFVILLLTAA